MDPKIVIRRAAENEEYYFDLPHALEEADKDAITVYDVEEVMIKGKINQKNPSKNRYRLRYKDIQIVVELVNCEVNIITVMREDRRDNYGKNL
ncbi:DUF4258 domain-containing protein [Desulfoscipio gibsoniae]|uniref:DUF4258 domain-containing protein n=1 Tax=Desulfoscipio gibsoniae DSM 7213 TaxID=767817 RepID=R4KP11_9FIRM|nr:DUF4258 domain-containing protein [Desulfoscipio gibsoniae]AGL02305.1 hypothetical protein Desgi_2907 [Desulfoscipio gibsoniae DSM 7213]